MNSDEIIAEREKTHGDWNKVAAYSQALKEFAHATPGWTKLRTGQREAIDMICVKISRILCGDQSEPDHWNDIAGYATLALRDCHANQSV